MKNFKTKLSLAALSLLVLGGIAIGQQGLSANFPVVGGSSYCGSTNNGVCQLTVPAGPTSLTGNETILLNTNLSQGRSPQSALVKPAALGANPIAFVTVTTPPANIVATNTDGGVVYTSATTITAATITLPTNAQQNQRYELSANRTITTLTVNAPSGDAFASNTTPTSLTASTTAPNGYTFICDKAGTSNCTWHRLR